ncbi:outer membrane lipoprotein-sorting protein [Candidatus Marinimicrobia bacterium]|nr:outer membrane lipoprotein-sorting protein [Candidatus Neomarinimicrobiota bacterium]
MNKLLGFIFILSIGMAQELSVLQIIEKVLSVPKPNTSISDIKLEIIRMKRGKEKVKVREFTRFQKNYISGEFKSKSLARFQKPILVKGTGLLSWVYRNGNTDQWFFLPKLKTVKRVQAKERSKTFMGTDFIYEDFESRKLGQDSLISVGIEYLNNQQCHVIMAFPQNESAYHSRKIWVNSQNWKIQKIEFYLNETHKLKTLSVLSFIEKNGFVTAGKMMMEKEDGKKTIMEINNFNPNVGLKDEIFSESFLIKI